MRIALDYDGTYTLDPDYWHEFMRASTLAGHDVRVVTARDWEEDQDKTLGSLEYDEGYQVIYTEGVAKKWYCDHRAHWTPDIWIDNDPRMILENSTMTPAQLAEWRRTREH